MEHNIESSFRAAAEQRYGEVYRQPKYGPIRRWFLTVSGIVVGFIAIAMTSVFFQPSLTAGGKLVAGIMALGLLAAAVKLFLKSMEKNTT